LDIYGYENLKGDVAAIHNKNIFEIFSIGKTALGKDILCIKYGGGPKKVFINGAHHALESITSAMLMRFLREIAESRAASGSLFGYNLDYIFKKSSVYIVPMVNPDGVELVKHGAAACRYKKQLIRMNDGKNDFSKWQSNIAGVDLNHNYDAGWEIAKKMEPDYNINGPGPTRFGGEYPESEPETRAMTAFSRREHFDLSISYHTQGEEIYYQYMNYAPPAGARIARTFAKSTGYKLAKTSGIASHGGYKDWFLKTFGKPAFTIEAGLGKNPLPFSDLDGIYEKNKQLLAFAAMT